MSDDGCETCRLLRASSRLSGQGRAAIVTLPSGALSEGEVPMRISFRIPAESAFPDEQPCVELATCCADVTRITASGCAIAYERGASKREGGVMTEPVESGEFMPALPWEIEARIPDGSDPWPCSPELARLLARLVLAGRRTVLEFGAGASS